MAVNCILVNIMAEANNTMFRIDNLAPGLAMFGTAFMALFSGMLIAKDRTSSFLVRLFASPMSSLDFILGYTLPLIIMALAQSAVTFIAACILGLQLTIWLLPAIFATAFTSLLFVSFGLLFGSMMNDKAVGGVCGALLTNVAGWLSGVFIPLDLIGGVFKKVADILPFYHSVQGIKAVLSGSFGPALSHLGVTLAYIVVIFAFAVIVFKRKMNGD